MPEPTKTPTTKPKPATKKATPKKAGKGKVTPKKAARRGSPQFDWAAIRREFIRGDDTLTLKALSDKEGYPSNTALKARSARENWAELRTEFRHQVDTKLRELDLDMKAEVRSTLGKLGQALIGVGMKGVAALDPEKLEPIDALRFVKTGADMRVKSAGMDEVKVRLGRIKSAADLENLSAEDLWLLAGMVSPDEEEDEDF